MSVPAAPSVAVGCGAGYVEGAGVGTGAGAASGCGPASKLGCAPSHWPATRIPSTPAAVIVKKTGSETLLVQPLSLAVPEKEAAESIHTRSVRLWAVRCAMVLTRGDTPAPKVRIDPSEGLTITNDQISIGLIFMVDAELAITVIEVSPSSD